MRNGLKRLFGIAVLMVAASGLAGQAEAAAIVYVTPTPAITELDMGVIIEIMIDADEPIGGFDMDVTWDESILTPFILSVLFFDPIAGFTFGNPVSDWESFPDLFRARVTGEPLGDNLNAQPFTIMRLIFQTPALGASAIDLSFVTLYDASGDPLDHTALGGVVCVVETIPAAGLPDCSVPVPEPGLMALFAAGLATVAVRRRQARGQSKA